MPDVSLPYVSHSSTSRRAAEFTRPRASTQRGRIYDFIEVQGERGATCDEVEKALGMIHATVSARITDLRRDGGIRCSGKIRKTANGADAQVYVLGEDAELGPSSPASREWNPTRKEWSAIRDELGAVMQFASARGFEPSNLMRNAYRWMDRQSGER